MNPICPRCGSINIVSNPEVSLKGGLVCLECGNIFNIVINDDLKDREIDPECEEDETDAIIGEELGFF